MGYKERNMLAVIFAFSSAMAFLISGTTSISTWKSIEEFVLSTINIAFVKTVFSIILLLASLGGILMLFSAWLLFHHKVHLARVLIIIGAGSGIISLVIQIVISLSSTTQDFTWLFSLSSLGIILSIFARMLSKKNRLRKLGRF